MDAKKIIGVTILVAVVVTLGVVIVRQMSMTPEMTPRTEQQVGTRQMPVKPGLTEEPQLAPAIDTKKPATVDAIVSDIDSEASADQSAVSKDADGDATVITQEGDSLNNVSQFYDETNL